MSFLNFFDTGYSLKGNGRKASGFRPPIGSIFEVLRLRGRRNKMDHMLSISLFLQDGMVLVWFNTVIEATGFTT